MGQDLLQLVNAGFNPLQEISERTGESMASLRKRMAEGKISFEEVSRSIIAATDPFSRFGGLSDEFGKTFLGRVSTLQDNLQKLARQFGQDLLPAAKSATEGLIEWSVETYNAGGIIQRYGKFILYAVNAYAVYALAKRKDLALTAASAIQNKTQLFQLRSMEFQLKLNAAANLKYGYTYSALNTAQKAAILSTTAFKSAVTGLWNILKTNPFTILVAVLPMVLDYFDVLGGEVKNVNDELDDLSQWKPNNAIEFAQKQATKSTQDVTDALRGEAEALRSQLFLGKDYQVMLDNFNKKYGTHIEVLKKADKKTLDLAGTAAQVKVEWEKLNAQIANKADLEQYILSLGKLTPEVDKAEQSLKTAVKSINDLSSKGLIDDFDGLTKGQSIKNTAEEIVAASDKLNQEYVSLAQNYIDLVNEEARLKGLIARLQTLTTPPPPEGEGDEKKKKELLDILALYSDVIRKRNEVTAESVTLDLKFNVNEFSTFQQKLDNLFLQLKDKQKKTAIDTANELQDALEPLIKENQELLKVEAPTDAQKKRIAELPEYRNKITERFNEILQQRLYQDEREYAENVRKITVEEWNKTVGARKEISQKSIDADIKAFQEQADLVAEAMDKSFNKMDRTLSLARFKSEKIRVQQYTDTLNAILFAEENAQKEKNKLDYLEKLSKTTNLKEQSLATLTYLQNDADITKEYNKKREKNTKETGDKTKKATQEKIDDLTKLILSSTNAITQVSTEILNAEIALSDRLISEQQKRVDRAREIADRGNAEMLQREQEKYDTLIKQRQKYVNQQKAIAMAEILINQTAIIIESIRTITREGASKGVPGLIAGVAALAAGIFAAQATAQQAMTGFETGGYTGDGHQKDTAGIVHKGEFVFTKEKTQKYRPLFEEIHKGRDPYLAMGVNDKIIVVNNHNMDSRLERIEKAILGQNRMQINIDERGIHGIVSQMNFKKNRLNTRF